ncbi:MAG: hypothetical protein HY661_19350 [Betaproteobacteria bacterium]|nr:hypothetical protein [Betaproteobacteria bacterium]
MDAQDKADVDAKEWCLPDAAREAITLLVRDAPDREQLPTFFALLKLDMGLLHAVESDRKSTRAVRLFARRRFAASLAANVHELLELPLGRGRNGPYYRVLTASFTALGLPAKDVRPYAIHGIESTTLSGERELRQIGPLLASPGKQALKDQVSSRRDRATKNRLALRKLLIRKDK